MTNRGDLEPRGDQRGYEDVKLNSPELQTQFDQLMKHARNAMGLAGGFGLATGGAVILFQHTPGLAVPELACAVTSVASFSASLHWYLKAEGLIQTDEANHLPPPPPGE